MSADIRGGGVIPDCASFDPATGYELRQESQRVEAFGDVRRATRGEPVVKNCHALICAIPIRSLRTKWSRTRNKAGGR